MFKLRFLPFFILFAVFAFASKVLELATTDHKVDFSFISNLYASEKKSSEEGGEKKEKKEEKKKEEPEPLKTSTTPPEKTTNMARKPGSPPKKEFSDIEVDLLQSLSKRREEIEKWNKELIDKQNLLRAAEVKLNNKLGELKALKDEVNILLEKYNQKEDEKIQSLVKIYESMKPKDAAKILEELEMPILLQVINKMKEAKAAPILAQMSAEKAKDLTVEYARQKKLPVASCENANNQQMSNQLMMR
jgi:flagellar motility protein MotE (MotC chaperone)